MTFQYLTVSCIPATGHVDDIKFQYLTVSCIPATDHVYDNSIPKKLCMPATGQIYQTVSCIPAIGYVHRNKC